MFKEVVEVTEVIGNQARIVFKKRKMCDCCRMSYFCGRGESTLLIDSYGFLLDKGDKIEIGVDEKKTFLASFLVFLLPAIIFVAGLIVFGDKGELVSFSLAFLGICIYYGIFRLFLGRYSKKFTIAILRKLEKEDIK